MGAWDLWYVAGDDWDYSRDVAAAGFITEDCYYHVWAYTAGKSDIELTAGTPIWATFNWDRSDGNAAGYDVWYHDEYGSDNWLDGGDASDLTSNQYFQWEEEIFDEIQDRYMRGEFSY